MTISYMTSGALATDINTVTPAYPGSVAVGNLAVLQIVSAHPDDPTPTTPSGWTLAGSASGGGGTYASGTGPRRITWLVRELTGGEVAPTTSVPSGAGGSAIGARISILARTAGKGWRWSVAFGEDTSSGTAFSAPSTDALTWAISDFCLLGYAWPNSAASTSARGVTAAGITFAAATSHLGDAVMTGYGARLTMAETAVTAGSGTQAPTVTATLTAASTGVGGVLRLREASSTITVAEQSAFPPRIQIELSGLAADDIVGVTVYRQIGDDRTEVRAASGIDVTGDDVLLRIDGEQPFGVPVTYIADLTDADGNVWELTSAPVTSTVDGDVISDAIRGIGARIKLESPLEFKRDRNSTSFNVNGRVVIVGRNRSNPSSTITARTESDSDSSDMDAVLDGLTEGVFLLRKQTSLPRLDGYYALADDTESPNWFNEITYWSLDVTRTDAWPAILEAAGFTLQDIADAYTPGTLQNLADDFPGTLLDIALHDWGN